MRSGRESFLRVAITGDKCVKAPTWAVAELGLTGQIAQSTERTGRDGRTINTAFLRASVRAFLRGAGTRATLTFLNSWTRGELVAVWWRTRCSGSSWRCWTRGELVAVW